MRRRAVYVEVILLYVFAMVAFAIRQSEKAFFEDWIVAIPKSQRKTELLRVVRDAGEAILSPAVGTGPGLIMAEIAPGVSVAAVIFANRAPLAFTQVRPPFFPGDPKIASIVQALLFRAINRG